VALKAQNILLSCIWSGTLHSGWPLTWKTWKSQGIPNWSGKSQGKWKNQGKVRGSEIRCVFSSSKYSKTRFSARAPPWTSLGELTAG